MELPNITPADITAALANNGKKKKAKQEFYYRRDEFGRLVMFYGRPPSVEVGNYFGTAGKTRQYNDEETTVVAYYFKRR